MNKSTSLNSQLLKFLEESPTPFHAVESMKSCLLDAGFTELFEESDWELKQGERYFVVRAGSAIVAFNYGTSDALKNGVRVMGAHTDSPCLKVKPLPSKVCSGYQELSVETYGGVLLSPWFDRDLSLAGRVVYTNGKGELKTKLIDFRRAIGSVPSLAIHLDRTANEGRKINPHIEMDVILGVGSEKLDFSRLLAEHLEEQGVSDLVKVLDFNLSFYDVQPPSIVGLRNEFIASARLDNLLSCFLGMKALIDSGTEQTCVLICNDHEEVGSRSEVGAQGPMLSDVLSRMYPDTTERQKVLRRSLMLSVDNAHGVHPNFASKHDENHGPMINAGPVIKFDACQGYATSSDSSAFLRWLAAQDKPIPLQTFVMRSDMRCGSTIGPITSAELGIQTIDIGLATFGMHSIRELGGSLDGELMYSLLKRFTESAIIKVSE